MSRFGGDGPRYSSGNLSYRDPPSGPRWDADRFATERDRRVTETVIERDRTYGPPGDYRSSPRRAPAQVYEEQRVYEDERYGPRGSRQERRYYEEADYTLDPRASRGAMVPFRPERPGRPEAPPRPGGLLRRQSSLDTFDRGPTRRYNDEYIAPPPRISVPVPRAPSPRRNRYEPRNNYEDVRIQEDDYRDDGFREYKEREWITRRRRGSSHSREREMVIEKEEIIEEKPFPRRGKTKMPKRMVHTKVLFDLGYPYYEENETIIIEKALGPHNIDEIINMSKDYYARDPPPLTLQLEAPPEIREEIFEEKITTIPLGNAPPSVQNWDGLRSPSPKSHRSHSRRRSRSRRGSSPRGEVIEKETIIERKVTREISPTRTERTHKSGRSRHHSRSSHGSEREEIIERKIIETDDFDESASVHIGPLALVRESRKASRSDRDLKEEIRALEAERRALRKERRYGDEEIVKVERIRERSPSRGRGEIILVDRDEVVEVRKDKRARSVAPSPGIIRAMMATLT